MTVLDVVGFLVGSSKVRSDPQEELEKKHGARVGHMGAAPQLPVRQKAGQGDLDSCQGTF